METLFFQPEETTTSAGLAALGLKHNPVTALLLPRPIAWISTVNGEGFANLAPFSFSGMVSQSPPMLMFCANATHVEGGDKDTLSNVRATGEFVFNLATFELRHEMNASSAMLPRNVDEFEAVGLEKAACRIVAAPRVARTPISLECKVVAIVDLPPDEQAGTRNTATIGRIVGVHVRRDLVSDGIIDVMRAEPLARLGYLDYAICGEPFVMERPQNPPAEGSSPPPG